MAIQSSHGNPGRTVPEIKAIIPDFDPLVAAAVLAQGTGAGSFLHGEGHWKCVAWAGLKLLPGVPGCDPAVVLLFALFHDSMRLNDGHDPAHGRRGGRFARSLHGSLFTLPPAKLDLLQLACDRHASGGTSDDPTVGVCWDADRLNLWRVGARPEPRFLSTEPAKRRETIRWASAMEGHGMSWGQIYQRFAGPA